MYLNKTVLSFLCQISSIYINARSAFCILLNVSQSTVPAEEINGIIEGIPVRIFLLVSVCQVYLVAEKFQDNMQNYFLLKEVFSLSSYFIKATYCIWLLEHACVSWFMPDLSNL